MHIVLLILKIIGITLLVILGLILLIVLLILFVPVRYSGEGEAKKIDPPPESGGDDPGSVSENGGKDDSGPGRENGGKDDSGPAEESEDGADRTVEGDENTEGDTSPRKYYLRADAKITWLLHIVSFAFNYSDGIGYILRIFGIGVVRGGNMEKPPKPETGSTGTGGKTEAETGVAGSETTEQTAGEEGAESTGQAAGETGAETAEQTGGEQGTEAAEQTGSEQETEAAEQAAGEEGTESTGKTEEETAEPNGGEEGTGTAEQTAGETGEQTTGEAGAEGAGQAAGETAEQAAGEESTETGEGTQQKSVVEKVKTIYNDVESILNDKKVERAYELVKCQIVKLLKAVLPKKISGYARYGFEDPAITGYITAFLASKYSMVRDLDIDPHFEDEILEGDLKFKGRIFMITMVRIGLKLYFNKDLRYTIERLKKFGKEGE